MQVYDTVNKLAEEIKSSTEYMDLKNGRIYEDNIHSLLMNNLMNLYRIIIFLLKN